MFKALCSPSQQDALCTPILYVPRGCNMHARFNRAHYYEDQNLRLVAGSIAIGASDNPVFEYGHANFKTIADFRSVKWPRALDAHMWLENEAGGVYDVVDPHCVQGARLHSQPFHLAPLEVLEGRSKEELRSLGLHYIPAPQQTQELLLRVFDRLSAGNYEKHLTAFRMLTGFQSISM